MSDVAKPMGLLRRNGTYTLRRAVPKDLRDFMGKTQIWVSLKTKDYGEAKIAHAKAWGDLDDMFKDARLARDSGHALADTGMSKDDALRLVRRYVAKLDQEWQAEKIKDGVLEDTALQARKKEISYSLFALRDPDVPDHHIVLHRTARKLLQEAGRHSLPGSPGHDVFIELLRLGLIELYERHLRHLDDDFSVTHINTLFDPKAPEPSGATLRQACDDWLAEYKKTHHVREKRRNKVEHGLNFLCEYFGKDTTIGEIDRTKCRTFRDDLNRLPPNRTKKFPKKSIHQVLKMVGDKPDKVLSFETQSVYLHILNDVMQHAVSEGTLDANPASGFKSLAKKAKAEDKRDPFTMGQLGRIFSAPLYVGCVDDGRNHGKPGPNVIKRGRYWVPLISLFSGMRLNEICQLRVQDVQVTPAGNPYFIVTDEGDDMYLKTESAKRTVPVHPDLVRMGLLDYRNRIVLSNQPNLFPDLRAASTGYRSDLFSKWFNGTFLPKVGAKTGTTTFHSLRHNFRDSLRRIEAPQEIVERLGGWAEGRKTSDAYGSGFSVDQLAEHMKKISYPDLDLSHLYEPSKSIEQSAT